MTGEKAVKRLMSDFKEKLSMMSEGTEQRFCNKGSAISMWRILNNKIPLWTCSQKGGMFDVEFEL